VATSGKPGRLTGSASLPVPIIAAGFLPNQYAVGVGFVEQAVGAQVAEHAALDNVLEFVPVVGLRYR